MTREKRGLGCSGLRFNFGLPAIDGNVTGAFFAWGMLVAWLV